MATINVRKEDAYFRFSEWYLPEMENIIDSRPIDPAVIRENYLEFKSREEALAYILNARARQNMYNGHRFTLRTIAEMPLDTWVIKKPEEDGPETILSEWFEGISNAEDYRIVVNRSPKNPERGNYTNVWKDGYPSMQRATKLRKDVRNGTSPELRLYARGFLEMLDKAYKKGPKFMGTYLKNSVHSRFPKDSLKDWKKTFGHLPGYDG